MDSMRPTSSGSRPNRPTPIPAETYRGADERHLYVYLKVRETPARFPRREGMARKRPLEASTGA